MESTKEENCSFYATICMKTAKNCFSFLFTENNARGNKDMNDYASINQGQQLQDEDDLEMQIEEKQCENDNLEKEDEQPQEAEEENNNKKVNPMKLQSSKSQQNSKSIGSVNEDSIAKKEQIINSTEDEDLLLDSVKPANLQFNSTINSQVGKKVSKPSTEQFNLIQEQDNEINDNWLQEDDIDIKI